MEEGEPASVLSVQELGAPAKSPYQGYSREQLQNALVEKEYQLECARDSVDQLSSSKTESARKDATIATLRKELAEYKKTSWSKDSSHSTLKERLATCETDLREKMEEMNSLQKELEKTKGQLREEVGRSAANEKMSSKLIASAQQTQKQQSQQKMNTAQIESLKQELSQKKSDISSLQERLKRYRSMNQDLQKRLEEGQSQYETTVKSEQQLRTEIAQLKNLSSDGKLLQAKHDFIEQELSRSKQKENLMEVELKGLREELTNLCENVSSLVGCADSGRTSPTATIGAVSRFAQEHSESNDKLTTLTQQFQQLEGKHVALCDCVDSIQRSWSDCKAVVSDDPLSAINTLVATLQSVQSQENLKDLLMSMQDVLVGVHSDASATADKLTQLTEKVATSYKSMAAHDAEDTDPSSMVLFMSKKYQSASREAKQLKQKLCGAEIEHSAALTGAVTAMRHDEDVRLKQKVKEMREEEKMKYSHQVEEMKRCLELEKQTAVEEVEARAEVVRAELENTQQMYEAQVCENNLLKDKLATLDSKLQDEELKRKEDSSIVECQKEELRRQLLGEVATYKEQSEQYALTIVALEEKLLSLMDKCNSIQTENVELAEKLNANTTTLEEEIKGKAEKKRDLDHLVVAMRKQLCLATKNGVEKQSRIDELEQQLNTEKRDRNKHEEQLRNQHLEEVADLRQMLSSREASLECQKTELQQLRQLLSERPLEKERSAKVTRQDGSMTLIDRREVNTHPHNTEVSKAGQQCLGERHSDIITKQRGVIAQLKQRISDLELAKPPVGSHQATLKELSRVRYELLKAKASPVQQEAPTAECTKALSSYHVSTEPQKGSRIKDALQQSEQSYMHLVNTIHQHLPEVQNPDLAEIDVDNEHNMQKVMKQRNQFTDILSRQLKRVQERARSKQSDKGEGRLEEGERSPAEVISQLESLLSATSEELEQQRRLNQALMKRKNFKENQVFQSS